MADRRPATPVMWTQPFFAQQSGKVLGEVKVDGRWTVTAFPFPNLGLRFGV
jgi:hypothetical protein